MRDPHPLTATKRSIVPRRMIFFDSEAYTEIDITDEDIARKAKGETVEKPHEPYLLVANYYNRRKGRRATQRYREFYAKHEGDDFLERFWRTVDAYALSNGRTWLFAHNAKYDVMVTRGVYWLVELGYKVVGWAPSNPFIMELEKEITHDSKGNPYRSRNKAGEVVDMPRKKTIMILSSTNYFQQSLASLGKIFGLPKLDFEHGVRVDMNNPEQRAQACTYAIRDVEILTAAMINFMEFVDEEDLGPFARTVAGQAFGAFRHRFMQEDQVFIHSNLKVLEVEREAYAGGRNECFHRLGRIPERVAVYDINSMYPHVMWEYRYPTRLYTFWREATPERVLEAIQDDYLVCCEVVVNTPYPIFHDKQHSTRLEFPTGRFRTFLSTPELIEGFERGLIESVSNVCVYEGDNLFAGYVDYFYNARLNARANGDAVRDALFKMFLTNLYGKFGQKNDTWEEVDEADPHAVREEFRTGTDGVEFVRIFGGKVWMKNKDPEDQEAFNSFPAIAAHVTAYARMLNWRIIETAGRENVYYTDTDSFFVNAVGEVNLRNAGLIDDKRLGAVKLEKTGFLWLNGCKDYVGVWETQKLKFPLPPKGAVPHRTRSVRRRVGKTWRWSQRQYMRCFHPRVSLKRLTTLYYKEVKIKGIPKSAKLIGTDAEGRLQFAITQWAGLADRFKKGNFQSYENKVVIKTLKRDYSKAVVVGDTLSPFVRDLEAEEREQAMKEIEAARKELAAAAPTDPIRALCLRYGFMRTPKPGERYFHEYSELPKVNKLKYFRKAGRPLDEWANDNGFTAAELLDQLRG